MPVIRVDFDGKKVSPQEIEALCKGTQEIVAAATGIEDTFVYANSPQVSYKIAPIEVFIQLSDHKIEDVDVLVEKLKHGISEWKQKESFQWPINLSFIPMDWRIEIGI